MNIVIIGAGASGLACAVRLKQNMPTAQVTVLEQDSEPGKRLLATGNGRCNLSNTSAEHSKEVLDFFSSIGLVTRTDDEGRIYPYSNQAQSVKDVLCKSCEKLNVQIITDCPVKKMDKGFKVDTGKEIISADYAVIACGGMAHNKPDVTPNGYSILKSFGHTITPLCPALVQLTSSNKFVKALKGQRAKCNMRMLIDGKIIAKEYGEVLFTDYGLSGIVTMNLSHYASENFASPNPKSCLVALDFAPNLDETILAKHVVQFGDLSGILPLKIAKLTAENAGNDPSLSAKIAKNRLIIINGTKGYKYAQITKGGAELSEFDNFRSLKTDGLYACGEVLDRQFPCGGFNLNFAFYSGITVADRIAQDIKSKNKI